jgi:hypothetical protein
MIWHFGRQKRLAIHSERTVGSISRLDTSRINNFNKRISRIFAAKQLGGSN